MQVYLDENFLCHTAQSEQAARACEVLQLDGKCRTYVEGMRYVPEGETWTREDGVSFAGPMLSPWRDSGLLEAAQGAFEDAMAAVGPRAQERVEAQLTYTAMMTDTLLPEVTGDA